MQKKKKKRKVNNKNNTQKHCLIVYTKIKSKWIKFLSKIPRTIKFLERKKEKLLEGNTESILFDLRLSNIFLGMFVLRQWK